MFPDFSYILHYFFGTNPDNIFAIIKTFGLFLGISFIASGSILYLEFKRKEANGQLNGIIENIVVFKPINGQEIFLQTIFFAVFGFKLFFIFSNFVDFRKDPAGIIFSTKGNIFGALILGLAAGIYWFYKMQMQKDKLLKRADVMVFPHQRVYEITLLAAVSGLIGSKLFSILENFGDFIRDPIGSFFSGSGLTIYGGLILAYIIVSRYIVSKKMHLLHTIDAIAPTLMIGYAFGRMGCHLSGDGDWGIVNELPKPSWFLFPENWWAFSYPNNVVNEGSSILNCNWEYCKELIPKVFPTPLYESILAFIITITLWLIRKRIKTAGILFFIYCILNGLERICIETIRVNPRYDIFGFHPSMAQGIAFLLILVGVVGILVIQKKSSNP